jgi:hypothetical protein
MEKPTGSALSNVLPWCPFALCVSFHSFALLGAELCPSDSMLVSGLFVDTDGRDLLFSPDCSDVPATSLLFIHICQDRDNL